MSSNSRNLKSPFLTTRCLCQSGSSDNWSANMSSNSRNLKLPSLTTRCLYWGVDLPVEMPIWALTVEISSHHSWPLDISTEGRSASCLASMSSENRNLKSPFLTTRGLYCGVDLPVNRQIWALSVEISSDHSWPLDASARVVDLPVDLPIWALTVEISSHHSWPLDASTGGVDLPVDWPIWVLTIEISSHHSWLLDASTGGG